MTESRRTWVAVIASCLLHILLLSLGARHVEAIPAPREEPMSAPLVFNFPPPEQQEASEEARIEKRLIDTATVTNEPIEDTDLISNKNSKAKDMSDAKVDSTTHSVEDVDDFDQLATPEVIAPQKPTVEKVEETPSTVQEPEPIEARIKTVEAIEPTKAEQREDSKVSSEQPKMAIEEKGDIESNPSESSERMKVAKAIIPPMLQSEPETLKRAPKSFHIAKGREGGGVDDSGILSFEAKKDELGGYMLEVKRRVELKWHTAIHLQYEGVKKAQASIACSIRPDGTLEYVKIKKMGDSMPFAIMCRAAVANAAPFPKLPIDVPEVYRSENIEITWRFSYM
jgi:hypothetical protein